MDVFVLIAQHRVSNDNRDDRSHCNERPAETKTEKRLGDPVARRNGKTDQQEKDRVENPDHGPGRVEAQLRADHDRLSGHGLVEQMP